MRFATRTRDRESVRALFETLARRPFRISNSRAPPLAPVFDDAVPSSRSVDSQMCH